MRLHVTRTAFRSGEARVIERGKEGLRKPGAELCIVPPSPHTRDGDPDISTC